MPRIERGDIWLVDLGYAAKVRPCLILSIAPWDTDRALITIVPHTTQARGTRFEIASSTSFLGRGVFDAQNPITVSHSKFLKKLGDLPQDQMEQVETAVRLWLGL